MAVKLGLDARLYRNTGSFAVPVWNEVRNVKDVTLNLEAGEADMTTRGNAGWRATVAMLKDGSIEFEMVWDTADDDFTAHPGTYGVELLVITITNGTLSVEEARVSVTIESDMPVPP